MGPTGAEILAVGAGILTAAVAVGYLIGPLTAVVTLLSANPLGILIMGLAIVLPLIYTWADRMGYIKKAMDWLSTLKIGEKLSGLGEFALKVLIPKAEFLSPMLAILKLSWNSLEMIGGVLVKIFDLWRNFISWELSVLGKIANLIKDIPEKIKGFFEDLTKILQSLLTKIEKVLGIGPEATKTEEETQNYYETELIIKDTTQ